MSESGLTRMDFVKAYAWAILISLVIAGVIGLLVNFIIVQALFAAGCVFFFLHWLASHYIWNRRQDIKAEGIWANNPGISTEEFMVKMEEEDDE